jgi:hypothetical protein
LLFPDPRPWSGEQWRNPEGVVLSLGSLLGLFLIFIPGLIVWIYSMYDAYITAGKMNAGTLEFRPVKLIYMVLFVAAAVFMVIAIVVAVKMISNSSMLTQLGPVGSADFFPMLRVGNLL